MLFFGYYHPQPATFSFHTRWCHNGWNPFFCPRFCYTNSKRGQILLFGYTPLGWKLQQWLFNSPTKRADEIPAPLRTKSHFAFKIGLLPQKETSSSTHWFSGVNSLLLSWRVSCSLVLRDTATPLEFGRCLHNHLPIPSLKKHGTPISFPLILWVVSFHQCSASNFILLFVHLLPVGLVGVSNMFFFPHPRLFLIRQNQPGIAVFRRRFWKSCPSRSCKTLLERMLHVVASMMDPTL